MIGELAPFVVAGVATGSIYALAAMGLVLTFKTSGLFNLAQGAQAALGAYVMWELWERHGWPWPLAAIGSLAFAGLAGGLLLERVAAGLSDKPATARIVATVGLLIAVQGLIVVRYGDVTIGMRYFLPTRTFSVLGTNVRAEQAIVVVLAAVVAAGLAAFFRRARSGVAMLAVVDDPQLIALEGTNPVEVRRSAWIIGSCFAAASGALLAPTLGLDATLLTLLVVQSFGAAAIGRFSSLPYTYVGALGVGLAQELLKYVVATDLLADNFSPQLLQPLPSNVPFLILFGVLVLNRKPLFEVGSRVVRLARPRPPVPARYLAAAGVAVLVAAVAVPHVVGTRIPTYMGAVAYIPVFASLYLLMRVSGQVSLCQVSFAAAGCAAAAHLTHAGVPFPLAVVGGGLAAVPLGLVIAVPATRLPAIYLAIATFGFGILVERLLYSTGFLFGSTGGRAAPRPDWASGDGAYFLVLVTVAVACCLAVVGIRRGRLGRVLRGLADAPGAVEAHGASAVIARTSAFAASAFIAGVGGAVIGPVSGTASGGVFNFGASLSIVAVLYVAGARPLLAAPLAALLYGVVPAYIKDPTVVSYVPVAFGVAALIAATGAVGALIHRAAASPRVATRPTTTSPAQARALRLAEGRS